MRVRLGRLGYRIGRASFLVWSISPVFLQLQDGSAEFLLQVAALLHGQRVRLFGEGLSDLGQVAVVVDLVSERERESV